VIVVDIIVIK